MEPVGLQFEKTLQQVEIIIRNAEWFLLHARTKHIHCFDASLSVTRIPFYRLEKLRKCKKLIECFRRYATIAVPKIRILMRVVVKLAASLKLIRIYRSQLRKPVKKTKSVVKNLVKLGNKLRGRIKEMLDILSTYKKVEYELNRRINKILTVKTA